MHVLDILKTKGDRLIAVRPDTTVRDTADTLGRERIGVALVRGQDGALSGIISERDIVRGIADHGPAALDMRVADLMTRSIVTCTPENSTEELVEKMLAEQIRHLPVMQDDALVGVVSVNDVMKSVLAELKQREKVLQEQVITAAGWSTDED